MKTKLVLLALLLCACMAAQTIDLGIATCTYTGPQQFAQFRALGVPVPPDAKPYVTCYLYEQDLDQCITIYGDGDAARSQWAPAGTPVVIFAAVDFAFRRVEIISWGCE